MNLPDLVRASRGGGRNTKTGRCTQCRQPVLRGLDEDMCALLVEVDPTPLTPLGEAMALLAGRKTYDLARDTGRWQLTRRGRWRITGPRHNTDVVPAHRCHDHTLEPFTTPTVHTTPTTAALAATECPY